jgi:transposase-like protein
MARARAGREEWQKRVQRWKDSGLTAKEFAAETGINAGTLQFWRYKLKHGTRSPTRTKGKSASDEILASLVEVHAPTVVSVDQRFEIELGNGRRLRVGGGFDAAALRALIAVLEAA